MGSPVRKPWPECASSTKCHIHEPQLPVIQGSSPPRKKSSAHMLNINFFSYLCSGVMDINYLVTPIPEMKDEYT
jgi:hypothetical protein